MPDCHSSLLKRKIIHFDMDAFYAAIEIRDNPALRGKPVVVGGSPNSRAVVCTASYEARKYGIHSAMACSKAARLCREAIFIDPHFEKYQAASSHIREIFKQYTALIEPLSLDEAFLDVTHNAARLYAVTIAKRIQKEVQNTLELTGSAGVAPNKLVAKIASDMKKPNGLTVVLPDQVTSFMQNLPLRKIHGIGPVTEKRLTALGLKVCSDVWKYSKAALSLHLGNMATWLYERSQGIDEQPVETERVRKSLGKEETFPIDLLELSSLREELAKLTHAVARHLTEADLKGKTITLKVKYDNFEHITRSQTIEHFTRDEHVILEVTTNLLSKTEAGRRRIRLLGISVSNF
ncbi:MAG: DNA polymerase IV [Gammaproteobacteria bacterium]|nr:DNA polymerase IV [Gammaproteobacteria bacterium]